MHYNPCLSIVRVKGYAKVLLVSLKSVQGKLCAIIVTQIKCYNILIAEIGQLILTNFVFIFKTTSGPNYEMIWAKMQLKGYNQISFLMTYQ